MVCCLWIWVTVKTPGQLEQSEGWQLFLQEVLQRQGVQTSLCRHIGQLEDKKSFKLVVSCEKAIMTWACVTWLYLSANLHNPFHGTEWLSQPRIWRAWRSGNSQLQSRRRWIPVLAMSLQTGPIPLLSVNFLIYKIGMIVPLKNWYMYEHILKSSFNFYKNFFLSFALLQIFSFCPRFTIKLHFSISLFLSFKEFIAFVLNINGTENPRKAEQGNSVSEAVKI